jgi:cytochrome c biogenesis protein CcmG, thiol:disulfide interchange protein DsbE
MMGDFMTQEPTSNPPTSSAIKPRPRWGRLFAWVLLAGLLALLGFSLARSQEGPVQVGKPAPHFSLTTFDGQTLTSESLRGKVVVVNFWASWCKPCEQEAADLESAWRQYRDRNDVVFIGVDWTDTENNAQQYLQRFGITYPNGPDLRTRISQSYRTTGVPETYIIDRDGTLSYIKLSPFVSIDEIKSAIDHLLSP